MLQHLQHLILAVLAFVGLLVSSYIYFKKARGEKLYCFSGDSCDEVVKSEYNKTFGVHNEVFGVLYFAFILFLSSAFFLFPPLNALAHEIFPFLGTFILLLTAAAAAFAAYLTLIQLLVIKKFCEWCLASALMSFLIFVLVLL